MNCATLTACKATRFSPHPFWYQPPHALFSSTTPVRQSRDLVAHRRFAFPLPRRPADLGEWYEIASNKEFREVFERNLVCTIARYSSLPDGTIKVRCACCGA